MDDRFQSCALQDRTLMAISDNQLCYRERRRRYLARRLVFWPGMLKGTRHISSFNAVLRIGDVPPH